MNLFNFWKTQKKVEQRNNEISYINPNALNNTISVWSDNFRYTPLNLSVIFRCVDLISDSMGMLPIYVTNKNGKEIKNNVSMMFENHFTLFKCIIEQVLLFGNGYAYIQRSPDGKPIGLRFLQNSQVTINYNEMRNELFYECSILRKGKISPNDMLHFKKYSLDGIRGLSVIAYAQKCINLSVASESTAQSYFNANASPSGILCAQGHTTTEQRQDAKTAFVNNLKAGTISVLPQEFKYQAIQQSSAEAQLLESREFNAEELCRFFGVNPILVGILKHGQYTEALLNQFLMQTLQPYIYMIEQELNSKLTLGNQKINLDETILIRTDKKSESDYYSTLTKNGILTINEAREALGYERKEGLDDNIIPYTDIKTNQIDGNNETTEEEQNPEEGNDGDNTTREEGNESI